MNDPSSSKSKSSPFRLAGAIVLQIGAYALGALAFAVVFFTSALLSNSPTLMMVLAASVALAITVILSTFAGKLFPVKKVRRYVVMNAATFLSLVAAATAHFVLRPVVPEASQFSAAQTEGVDVWELPTGSKIAVRHVRSLELGSKPPIIILHGGPGAYSVSFKPMLEVYSELTRDGHDVYFYDQVGGGLSARLENINEYSLDRHIDDLKAIQQRIGAKQVALIGSSWGATLAANYIAKYPDDIARAVFSGPGPIFRPDWAEIPEGSLDDMMNPDQKRKLDAALNEPRLLAALILQGINPQAAAKFAPEKEMGPFFDKVANDHYLPLSMCDPTKAVVQSQGFGFWSNRMTGASLINRTQDPKPALARNSLPVFILRGTCDYKKEAVAKQYALTFPNSTYAVVHETGHMIYGENPREYLRLIREFLQ